MSIRSVYTLQCAWHAPKFFLPLQRPGPDIVSWAHQNNSNGNCVNSFVFVGLTVVFNRQTARPPYINSNRAHLMLCICNVIIILSYYCEALVVMLTIAICYQDSDHRYENKGHRNIQLSRKMGCPAKIDVKKIVKFPNFQVKYQWSLYIYFLFGCIIISCF